MASTPMMPPAPPLFSMTTVWPSSLDNGSISSRAVRSTPPPGGNGTMILIGRLGYLSWAPAPRVSAATGNASAPISRLLRMLRKTTPFNPALQPCRRHAPLQLLHRDFAEHLHEAVDVVLVVVDVRADA